VLGSNSSLNSKKIGKTPRLTALLLCALFTSAALVTAPDPAAARRSSSKSYGVERDPVPGDPLTIVISLGEQRLKVYDSQGVVASSPISSGTRSHPTQPGIFSVLEKNRTHFSNLYYSAPMPNMQRLTWSGVALHAGHLPGYPASHGCIRLPHAFSKQLFSMTNVGTRVIVNDDGVEPQPIEHPQLFAALPPGEYPIPKPIRRPDNLGAHSGAAGVGGVSALLGVTPAAAAEAAIELAKSHEKKTAAAPAEEKPVQRTRAMALAERQQAIDDGHAAVAQAETDLKTAADRVNEINDHLKTQYIELRKAKAELPSIERAVRKADSQVTYHERQLASFVRDQKRELARAQTRAERRHEEHEQDGSSSRSTEDLLRRAAAREEEAARDEEARLAAAKRETELEHNVLDAEAAAKSARDEVEAQKQRITGFDNAIATIKAELVAARKHQVATKNALEDARKAEKRAVAALKQFSKPATILISRATGKLQIRQGFEDVYEASAKISFDHSSIGTHVFTASRYKDTTETQLDWRVMTLTDIGPALPKRPRHGARQTAAVVDVSVPPPATASNALDRIEVSDETRLRIAELVKPGSTLIITDRPLSRETGRGTDLIIEH